MVSLVMASSVSSFNDLLEAGVPRPTDLTTVQRKLHKMEKCIAEEEQRLQSIQDDLIRLGIAPHGGRDGDRHRAKMKQLEEANDKASRHLQQYKVKKRKYEAMIGRMLEEKASGPKEARGPSPQVPPLPGGKGGSSGRILEALMRRDKNGESGGSARSKESRGSAGAESVAGAGGEPGVLLVPGALGGRGSEGVSVSSVESDSMESQQRRLRRVEEIGEVVEGRLEPLRGDVGALKDKLEQVLKCLEESKSEQVEERKGMQHSVEDLVGRCGYVEQQIHDLIELHQKESSETKTYLVDTQDKMHYVVHERLRDMKEEMTLLNTRIQKMEHRQIQDEALARTEAAKSVMGEMAFKMVDCVLLLGQLVIAVVGAVTQFFQMTAENSTRLVIFLVAVIALLVLWQLRADIPFAPDAARWLHSLGRPLRRGLFRVSGGWMGEEVALNDTVVV